MREGDVFALLKDFLLVLQTISTSLKQMAPVEEGEEEDLLVLAFEQLAIAFKLKFDKAFDIKKEYKAKVKKSRDGVGSVDNQISGLLCDPQSQL